MKVNNSLNLLIVTILLGTININSNAQCANTNNIYSFEFDGRTYEVIKENKTWIDAVACAIERGGKLAEINDVNEQNEIQNQVILNAGINTANTTATDGGGGAYVWLGGNDIASEGDWMWDGNNDGNGTNFWEGNNYYGFPILGNYHNWGSLCPPCPQNEPDNYQGNQNALGLSLNGWLLGQGGQWNDLSYSNKLYYLIEYSTITSTKNFQQKNQIEAFPNPASNTLTIKGLVRNSKLTLTNISGNQVIKIVANSETTTLDISRISKGVYFLTITNDSVTVRKTKKIVITD